VGLCNGFSIAQMFYSVNGFGGKLSKLINRMLGMGLDFSVLFLCHRMEYARKTCQEEERGVCFGAAQLPKNTPHLIPFDDI
jgi:hypothetical protein